MVGLLRPHGHFVFVGIPEEPTIPKLGHVDLIMGMSCFIDCLPACIRVTNSTANAHVTGSAIGSPSRIAEMLKFAGDHKIKGWVKRYPLDKANEAVVSMDKGEARYRYVLVNTQNGGKLEE
jgi:D-arabinose 1-dehydrogenase-like Zn-dependent alcohol dehydrogenase